MGRTSSLPDNLPQLQNLIKRDPDSYKAEFEQQYRRYESNLEVFLLQPSEDAKTMGELIMFIAQVSHCYRESVENFSQQLHEILSKHAQSLQSDTRMVMCRALMLLRSKGLVKPTSLFQLFFQLFRCQDKLLRSVIYNFIIQDVKNLNTGHKDNKLNKSLQNFMYTMLSDNNSMAAKMCLSAMVELYRRKIWNDAKTVNVISTGCFSKCTKVLATALNFFLGQDEQDMTEDDSEDEDGPTARDIIMRFATAKKSSRAKQKRDKAMKALRKQKKNKHRKDNTDFSAIHLLHDPQGFCERLYKQLQNSSDSFEVRLMMLLVVSRLIGVHQLFLFNFYPFLQRFLNPHQRDVTKILMAAAQASHPLIPPEIIQPTIMTIANNFITERNASEVMAVGLNSVREICARCPLAMTEDLLRDLTQYKTRHDKTVMSASRSLVQLYRRINPQLLMRKDRGAPTAAGRELAVTGYGETVVRDYLPGTETLPDPVLEQGAANDEWESCSEASDCSGSWCDVSSEDEVDEGKMAEEKLAAAEEESKTAKEERIGKAQMVSRGRILTQREFQVLRAHQAASEVLPAAARKKKTSGPSKKRSAPRTMDEGHTSAELVSLNDIELVNKKRAHDRESRLATVLAGREDREQFGRKRQKLDPFASTTNKQKKKHKQYMMVREKAKRKHSGRSFRDKQIALRNALLKRAKQYK